MAIKALHEKLIVLIDTNNLSVPENIVRIITHTPNSVVASDFSNYSLLFAKGEANV